MNTSSINALKLKSELEAFLKQPSIGNGENLLKEIEKLKGENFQLVQNVFLSRLLVILDSINNNELKTVIIKCINLIIAGSKIEKDLPYKTLLCIILKQIYDFESNSYRKSLPEELKIAAFNCYQISSQNLEDEIVQSFFVSASKILLSQCIFVCKEAILKETYIKLRVSAVEALMALTQNHDKFDFNDIVLREQISKIIFIVLPQIATVLIKVCQEDTLRGPRLIKVSLKTLGRFLCLILEDYEKKSSATKISNKDFMKLIKGGEEIIPKGPKVDITKVEKSPEWLRSTSENLNKLMPNLKTLRASEYKEIRYELARMSFNLLSRCFPNVKMFSKFLIENLISCCDDGDGEVKEYSLKCMKEVKEIVPNLSADISDLFGAHLSAMPRVIQNGLESEQIAAFTLLNSFLLIDCSMLENKPILEKFIKILLSCCEIDTSSDLVLFETSTNESDLKDDFYQLKMPWKKFKIFQSETAKVKFLQICKNVGASPVAHLCINYLLGRIDSLEYLVLIIEIMSSEKSSLQKEQIENVMEEFLDESYWNLELNLPKEYVRKHTNEEWYQDSTPGLYESAIEIKIRDANFDDDDLEMQTKLNLKIIRYHVLCTCFVTELVGCVAVLMGKNFQPYILRTMHKILEKAGNTKFLIRSAGLHSIQCITKAMGYEEISELINQYSDFILFNIQTQMKRSQNDESFLSMISAVFKFSKSSVASYVEDIILTASDQLIGSKYGIDVCAYLKLFNLYACSVKIEDEKIKIEDEKTKCNWKDFKDQCLFELEKVEVEEEIITENTQIDEENDEPMDIPEDPPKPELPLEIQLILKVLKASIPFFASSNSTEVILVHKICENSLPTLQKCDDTNFLPTIHQMWYPFTKQFQSSNLVILQHSFRLLSLIASLAKDFVYHRSTEKAIPVINKFLNATFDHKNVSYTQEFKLQKEILKVYGQLMIDLGIEDKMLDENINVILKYKNNQNEQLIEACEKSIEALSEWDPILMNFKLKKF